MTSIMPFENWVVWLAQSLGVTSLHDASQTDQLTEELGLDSIQLFSILLMLEEDGVEISEEAFGKIQTIGDLYEYSVMSKVRFGM